MRVSSILEALAEANGAGVRVAIVDSGVDPTHPHVGDRLVRSLATDTAKQGLVPVEHDDVCGHGTAAAGQVLRFAPAADLVSVRVLDASRESSSEALLTALHALVEQDVHLVSMSLSTMRTELALRIGHAVDDLFARDVACVCARGYHETGRDYPTSFASTIAVTYARLPEGRIAFRPRDLTDFDAAGVDISVAWLHGQVRRTSGSSYACPLVAGLAARLLSVRRDLAPYELMTLLREFAVRQAAGWWEPWMDAVARPLATV